MENNYKVYRHRDSQGDVFYIGCSKDKHRPFQKYNTKSPKRSLEWFERCGNQFTVEILAEGLSRELAYELEEFLISEYKRTIDGGVLMNKSIGGFGGNGVCIKHSEETKNKISNSLKGRIFSEEHRIKLSEAQTGDKHFAYGKPAHNRKKVICTKTGKIWESLKDCVIENNLNYYTVVSNLNGRTLKNNTTFKYLENGKEN